MSAAVKVDRLPRCDFAGDDPKHPLAVYDFKTKQGPWANGCQKCFMRHRMFEELGTGKGQKLYVEMHTGVVNRERPAHLARYQELLQEHGTIEAVYEATGGEW